MTTHVEDFIRALENRDSSPHTVRAYRADLGAFSKWYEAQQGKEIDFTRLTHSDLRTYRAELVKAYKPATVNRKLDPIRALLKYLLERGLIESVPQIKGIPRPELSPKAPERIDVNRLIRNAEREGVRETAIIWMLRGTGCRVGELASSTLPKIAISERRGSWEIVGKFHIARTVPLNASVRKALKAWLDVRPNVAHDAIFTNNRGEPLSDRSIYNLVVQLSEGKIHPHLLRHFAATEMLRAGTDIVAVAKTLGHRNISSVAIYTQPGMRDLERAVDLLSDED